MDNIIETIHTPRFTTEIVRRGAGSTLLMIMGGGTGKGAWNALIDELAPHVTCVAYDNRGTGAASDVDDESLTVEDLAQDAAALIEALGEGPVHVCGVSMGGFIAMRLAAMRPDLIRTLTLHATAAKLDQRTVETGRFRLQLLESGLADAPEYIRSFLRLWAAGSAGLQAPLPGDVVNHARGFSKRNYLGHVHAIWGHDMSPDDLAAITAPTLITAGAEDIMTTAENARHLHRSIEGSRLVVIGGAGHVYYFEDPVLTASLQYGWISSYEKQPAGADRPARS
ncbi:alpha/beta hydrolase [Microbacterium sp. zg.Y625]|uniref:alpha/beta fold hydrolase n=1 Tax=Microbacterium jiangjiandongii TaxID=3049071 RepID=UPI00214BAB4A|nr:MULTISPECIES: alpha/beta hydrolase [unclassified Microbacterium]MCR2793476.1 alpha/beta hydrolase [Microbacterium sp. zg.Y625]MCR2815346.1 alpha/beta hydrolase [Microbacterium sp. zg.Y843]WIM25155.1 alpha/beta hydrolase [Microbacterium sp. zg-Y625]